MLTSLSCVLLQMAEMLTSLSRDDSKLAQALLAPADLQNIIEKEVRASEVHKAARTFA